MVARKLRIEGLVNNIKSMKEETQIGDVDFGSLESRPKAKVCDIIDPQEALLCDSCQ